MKFEPPFLVGEPNPVSLTHVKVRCRSIRRQYIIFPEFRSRSDLKFKRYLSLQRIGMTLRVSLNMTGKLGNRTKQYDLDIIPGYKRGIKKAFQYLKKSPLRYGGGFQKIPIKHSINRNHPQINILKRVSYCYAKSPWITENACIMTGVTSGNQ